MWNKLAPKLSGVTHKTQFNIHLVIHYTFDALYLDGQMMSKTIIDENGWNWVLSFVHEHDMVFIKIWSSFLCRTELRNWRSLNERICAADEKF